MRSSSVVLTALFFALVTASVGLGAPTIIPGSGFPAGIDDLEVGSDIYDVTFRACPGFTLWGTVPSEATFYGDSVRASLAGSAIDDLFNASPVPILGSYDIVFGGHSGWYVHTHHTNIDGTWQPTHEGWAIGFRSSRRWALFTWTGTVEQPGPTDPPVTPPDVIPAPGALLLGGIGAGVVSWLRRRSTI